MKANDLTILNSMITNIYRTDTKLILQKKDGSETVYNTTKQEPDFYEINENSKNFIKNKQKLINSASLPDVSSLNNGDIVKIENGEEYIVFNNSYKIIQRSIEDRNNVLMINKWENKWYKKRSVVIFNNKIYIATDNTNTYPNQYGARWIIASELNMFANICELQSVNLSGYIDVSGLDITNMTETISTSSVLSFIGDISNVVIPSIGYDIEPVFSSSDNKIWISGRPNVDGGSVVINKDLSYLGDIDIGEISFDIDLPYISTSDCSLSIIVHSMGQNDYQNPSAQYLYYNVQSDREVYRESFTIHESLGDIGYSVINNFDKVDGNIESISKNIDMSSIVGKAKYITFIFDYPNETFNINEIKLSNFNIKYNKQV